MAVLFTLIVTSLVSELSAGAALLLGLHYDKSTLVLTKNFTVIPDHEPRNHQKQI